MTQRIKPISFAALLAGIWLAASFCHQQLHAADMTQNYPSKAVRLIVPYPPGGAGDIVGRMLSARLTDAFGQQVVVDNRPGGAQIIATQMTAKAAPDGYTLFLASATHGINPGLLKKLPYDSIKDFAPITLVADSPLLFIAHPSLGVHSIKELVAQAKRRPGRINYASSGPGTGGHLSVELLKWMTGIDLVHVPYKGAGPALTDLIGGQVQMMCTSPLPWIGVPSMSSAKNASRPEQTAQMTSSTRPARDRHAIPVHHRAPGILGLGLRGLARSADSAS